MKCDCCKAEIESGKDREISNAIISLMKDNQELKKRIDAWRLKHGALEVSEEELQNSNTTILMCVTCLTNATNIAN